MTVLVQYSCNLWIVRYLYIPLGDMQRLSATGIPIFTFVTLWHNLTPGLLAWGWLAALHPAGGRRNEDPPAFPGACLPCGRSTDVEGSVSLCTCCCIGGLYTPLRSL
jgi:hypothetical protein